MGFWLPKNLQTGKTSSHILKNTLSWHYRTLQPTCIWKYILRFYKWKIWKKLTVNRQSYHPIETLVKTTSTVKNPGKKKCGFMAVRFVWRVINAKFFFVIKILFNTDRTRELIGTWSGKITILLLPADTQRFLIKWLFKGLSILLFLPCFSI